MSEKPFITYGFNSETLANDSDSWCVQDEGEIDMNIYSIRNYIGYSFSPNKTLELVNVENNQLIFINLKTKKYQIYKVEKKKIEAKFIHLILKIIMKQNYIDMLKENMKDFFIPIAAP